MSNNPDERTFKPLTIAIMTVSDTRTEANDKSGDALVKLLTGAGHKLAGKRIIPDDIYRIRAAASEWIADDAVNAVITTGACRTGWEKIISHQLDYRTRPCNLVELMPRVLE